MATASTSQLLSLRDKLTGAIQRQSAQTLRSRIEAKSGVVIAGAATVVGGAVGGAAFAKFDKGIFGMDADLVLGSVGHVAAGLVGGKHAPHYHAASSGMLAGWASRNATLYVLAKPAPSASAGGSRPAPRSGAAAMTSRQWSQAFNDA